MKQLGDCGRRARERPREEAVIFLHLPKTAGTTLNRLIEWEYRLSEMYSIDPVLFEWSAAHLRKLPLARLRKTRMFKGHMLFGLHKILPQPSTYIRVFRKRASGSLRKCAADHSNRTGSIEYISESRYSHSMRRLRVVPAVLGR